MVTKWSVKNHYTTYTENVNKIFINNVLVNINFIFLSLLLFSLVFSFISFVGFLTNDFLFFTFLLFSIIFFIFQLMWNFQWWRLPTLSCIFFFSPPSLLDKTFYPYIYLAKIEFSNWTSVVPYSIHFESLKRFL